MKSNSDLDKFKVIHWNILADSLSDSFPHVDQKYLEWTYRKQKIVEKISLQNADIINLAEVDSKDRKILDDINGNYKSIYYKKNSDDNTDGLLMLININRFDILEEHCIVLKEGRSQIAIILKLHDKNCNHNIVVVGTHLKAKPGYEQQRLEQCKKIISSLNDKYADIVGSILLGDFNDTQNSPFHEYLINEAKFIDGYMYCCAFHNKHIYSNMYTTFKTREYTICRTIDYIFYKASKFYISDIIDPPNKNDIPNVGLPCAEHPSDHVMIGAVFTYNE